LYPFNPDKVLKDIPKPVSEPTGTEPIIPILKTCEIDLCPQGEVLHTPVIPEGLTLLYTLIKQDACAEDDLSKQRLQRHTQKFANAAQISFAEHVLQRDQILFIKTINNEAKVRRNTKRLILGKAKVMSYEDLEEARAQRAAKKAAKEAKKAAKEVKDAEKEAKDAEKESKKAAKEVEKEAKKAATAGKSTRGRKRKGPAEADVLEPKAKVADAEHWLRRMKVRQHHGEPQWRGCIS
jgi:hypothetical protein